MKTFAPLSLSSWSSDLLTPFMSAKMGSLCRRGVRVIDSERPPYMHTCTFQGQSSFGGLGTTRTRPFALGTLALPSEVPFGSSLSQVPIYSIFSHDMTTVKRLVFFSDISIPYPKVPIGSAKVLEVGLSLERDVDDALDDGSNGAFATRLWRFSSMNCRPPSFPNAF